MDLTKFNARLKQSQARRDAEAARAASAAADPDNFNDTLNFPRAMHDALALYLVMRDEERRIPRGLGCLENIAESDPEAWERFVKGNRTATFRLEDKSDGMTRLVTGYANGSVTFQMVAKATKQELIDFLAKAAEAEVPA